MSILDPAFSNNSSDGMITLIRPPIIFSATAYSTPVTLPIGLAYIASLLRKHSYPVNIVDCVGMDIDRITTSADRRFKMQGASFEKAIEAIDLQSDIIGFSVMFSQEWPFIRSFIKAIRKAFPHAIFVVGGEHVTALPEYTLRDCPEIDFAVAGEGELSFLGLCSALRKKQDLSAVPGICYLSKDGSFNSIPKKRIVNVDEMPWPAWDLLELKPYFQPNFTMGISHGQNLPILATRGCPYQCTFCSNANMWTTKYVMRNPNDVVDEIEYNIKHYGANGIDFFDLTAIVQKKWVMEFTEELKRRKIKVPWSLPSGTRSEALDSEVLSNLKETGMELLVYAPESGSSRVLKDVKKRVNLPKMISSIKMAKKNLLTVKLNLVMGFPNEKRIDVLKTVFMIWYLAFQGVDDADLSLFSPYPGSELFRQLSSENKISVIDDTYFENLLVMYDFTFLKSYCKSISGLELNIYRVIAMSIFYLISYLWFPTRILRLFPFMLPSRQFIPRSILEQRLYDIVARVRLQKKLKST